MDDHPGVTFHDSAAHGRERVRTGDLLRFGPRWRCDLARTANEITGCCARLDLPSAGSGFDVAVSNRESSGVAEAEAMGETRGSIRLAAYTTSDRIVGCRIVGPDAGSLVHEAVIAMTAGLPYRHIGDAIYIHPTLAEGVNAATGGVHRPAT